MSDYSCNICNYKTTLRNNFERHLNSKKHKRTLIIIDDKLDIIDSTLISKPFSTLNEPFSTLNEPFSTLNEPFSTKKTYICELCEKEFGTKSHLTRHNRLHCKCKKELMVKEHREKLVKEQIELKAMEEIKQLVKIAKEDKKRVAKDNKKDKQIEILQKTVNKLMDKVGNTTINNNNLVNNNVQLNCFGKENLDMITDDIKKEMIKGPFKMMPKLLELIYFNKKYPENHTMKLVNKNKELMKIHKKKGWELVDKVDTIDYLLEDKNYTLDSYYDNNTEIFSKMIKKTYNNFRNLFDSRDKELWKQIKRDVDLLLWNNM
uniref:C2H2-type domain-containing protein n=1 Tax=viral metagenome TaxID=1070528 RepID=A0A6C0J6L2_9ZZZZ